MKSDLHENAIPWKDVRKSGWGLYEQGKKISNRDLDKFTDISGFNRYNPYAVMEKYGADALRHWAARAQLGHNLKNSEKDIWAGRKIVIKLWNFARFCAMQLEGFDPEAGRPAVSDRTIEDRWIISELQKTIEAVTAGLDEYNYRGAIDSLETFFWDRYCDDYLEMVKDRFWQPERYPDAYIQSTRATLWETLRDIISLFAPFLPFVTEEIYQRMYQPAEGITSLHIAQWHEYRENLKVDLPEINLIREILDGARKLRSELQIPQNRPIETLVIDADNDIEKRLKPLELSIMGAVRAKGISYDDIGDGSNVKFQSINIAIIA